MICANSECGNSFERGRHNQIYCSAECCKIATNIKIKERYYKNKARRHGTERLCVSGCGTKLSRYNASDKCAECEAHSVVKARASLLDFANVIIAT